MGSRLAQDARTCVLCYMTGMMWTARFPKPIVLKDGRKIASLIQARNFLATLPALHLKNAHWEYASDLIYDAARHAEESLIPAYQQLQRALKMEGLI